MAFAPAASAQEADLDRLRSGAVVVEKTRLEERGGSVRVSMFVEAPAKTVWEVISSCEQARKYLRGMEECEVLVDEPDRALTHHVVDPGWMVPEMDYRFETRRKPYRRMDIELTGGNLEKMDGYWRIESVGSGVVVEHEVRIRPKAPAPRWLIRRMLGNDLPDMMACIRSLSNGSPTEDLAASDRKSCQGSAAQPAQ